MKMLLVKTNFYYHSHIWPEAQAGSTRWFPPDKYEQLVHDRPNCFSVVEMKDILEEGSTNEVKPIDPPTDNLYPLEDTVKIDTSWLNDELLPRVEGQVPQEVQDGKESETFEETSRVCKGGIPDIKENGRVKRTRKRNPGKQNKECVEIGKEKESPVEEG
jgi:hypothetical protein